MIEPEPDTSGQQRHDLLRLVQTLKLRALTIAKGKQND